MGRVLINGSAQALAMAQEGTGIHVPGLPSREFPTEFLRRLGIGARAAAATATGQTALCLLGIFGNGDPQIYPLGRFPTVAAPTTTTSPLLNDRAHATSS